MPARTVGTASVETREERIEAILKELRPKIDEAVRQLVERAVDVPEAEEFGAIDFEFRQVSLVSAAAGVDGAWGSEGAAGLLLLRPVPAEFSPLR